MPIKESMLEAAMVAPFLSRSGRCWMIAQIGTMKKPAKNPYSPRNKVVPATLRPGRDSSAPKRVMPSAPSGIRPYSILWPDRYPAQKLPSPIPTAMGAIR